MSLKPYLDYKDSGVEWLGDVPNNWRVVPLWTLFRRSKRFSTGNEEELLSVYRDHGVIPKASRDDNFNKASEDLSKYQLVEPGDLVVNKMKAWQGSVAVSNLRGIVSPAYFVFRSQGAMNLRYMHYLMRTSTYFQLYASMSKGVRPNQWDLDPNQHRMLPVLFPDIADQQTIANYLDHEAAEIDGFIADQEELIALLSERRAATITQAVTRGLDPTVPMKDSGVEWLGPVGNHWHVGRVKHVGTVVLGKMLQPAAKGPDDVESTYLRAANVQSLGRLDLSSKKSMWFSQAELARLTLRAGDVVIVEGGVGGFGRAAYVSQNLSGWAFQNSIIRIRPASSFDGRFVNYVFLHLREVGYIHMAASVTSMPHFTAEKVEGAVIGWPEYGEQREIADYLDRETAEIDAAIADAQQAITLSKERRAALISAAVTGKIDVRDHVSTGAEGAA